MKKIDLFIDDNIKNLDSVKGIVDSVLLFNSKINLQQDCNFKRVSGWKEIYDYINNI